MRRLALILLLALIVPPAMAEGIRFREVSKAWGIDFRHNHGGTGKNYILESSSGGLVMFDYDLDGDQDLFFVDGGRIPGSPYKGEEPRSRLFRNDGARFVDVTDASGIKVAGYGLGGGAGDVENDGDPDLYVTQFGHDQLFINQGDGTFVDGTARAGVSDPLWSSSAAFADTDRDGDLDLYVANYVDFSVATFKPCVDTRTGIADYCGPQAYNGLPDSFYRNRGDGTFEDISARGGIARQPGPALGVIAFDADRDGWTDVYVANDGAPSFLWMNRRDGTFRDDALLAGAAVNRRGQPEAGMGVDAGDFDADGDEDIFITHLTGETNTLYVNDGTGMFEDRSTETGAALGSLPFTSFGTSWIDYDNDGWLDLFITSGAVRIQETRGLSQTDQLYRNAGGRLEEVPGVFKTPGVGRGAAFGDVDNDGDTDILVLYNNGPARLLLNQVGGQRPWTGVDGGVPGERVEVLRPGGPALWRRSHTDGSYASASDPRVIVGLGDKPMSAVRIHRPGGKVEEWRGLPAGKYMIRKER